MFEIQEILSLPIKLTNELIVFKRDELEAKAKKYEPKILELLKTKKKATSLEIAEHFGLNILEVRYILKRMEEKGLIVVR